ncbi:MAG TPA: lysophospholipid acyltransferase family protein [Acetobacteraceae bacterium]|nr:lysophospholipid acyltransferase family protein [Acetobacteraceae bacterium]
MKRLLRHPAVQNLLARVLGLYLAFALRTTRWRLEGAEHVARHAAGVPVIAAFWHERLPLMPILWLRVRRMSETGNPPARMHVLVSRHRDGRFIGAVVRRFAVNVVLGSSSRGGAAGLRTLLGLLDAGAHVAITPDGPRGPRRIAAPGVAQLAALSGAPVLPCAAQTSRYWILRSWDRMVIPRPFGRGVVVCRPAIPVPRDGWQDAVPLITDALNAATTEADRLCAA